MARSISSLRSVLSRPLRSLPGRSQVAPSLGWPREPRGERGGPGGGTVQIPRQPHPNQGAGRVNEALKTD